MAKSIFQELKDQMLTTGNSLNRIIGINLLIFLVINLLAVILALFQLKAGWYAEITRWLMVPASPVTLLTRPWTLISYMFLHTGFFHILFNMLWFYWIGRIFQEYLGNKKLVSTYILGGLAGAFIYILAFNIFPLFRGIMANSFALGASASVLAVVVGTATLLPNYTIRLFLFGNVALKYLVLVMVLIDLLQVSGSNAGGHFAHLGGAAFGFIYIKQLQAGRDLAKGFNRLLDWLVTFFRPGKSKLSVSYRATSKTTPRKAGGTPLVDRIPQSVVDTLLDKIARQGYDSLSRDEKDILLKASKQ
jgi:membrane associated rhomboid family serine protease